MKLTSYQRFVAGSFTGYRTYCRRDAMIARKNGTELVGAATARLGVVDRCHTCRAVGTLAADAPDLEFEAFTRLAANEAERSW